MNPYLHYLIVLLACYALAWFFAWLASPSDVPEYRLGWAWRLLTGSLLFFLWVLADYTHFRAVWL